MVFVNEYKAKALECLTRANDAYSGDAQREWIELAFAYIRLVELAETNAVDVMLGTPKPERRSIQ